MPENCPRGYCIGMPRGVICSLTRVRVTSGAPGLRSKGQALAIAEIAAAVDVIKISVVTRALRQAACDELALWDCDVPRGQLFFFGTGRHKKTRLRVGRSKTGCNWCLYVDVSRKAASMIQPPSPPTQATPVPDPEAAPCPRCGVIDRPLLSEGSGPHACKASCAHCGRFLRWISLHAPSERMARRAAALRHAMQKYPASAAQLSFLLALGDTQAAPTSMAEASERIEELKARNSNAPGWRP